MRARILASYSVTTPIFYVNAAPHLGHLYTALLADASCRWKSLNNREIKLVTGTDEHGLKIQRAAALHNQSPAQYCQQIAAKYNDMFNAFNIEYTDFIRTTDNRHKEAVHEFWNKISGYITKGFYRGWYCPNDEAFLSDSQVQETDDPKGGTVMTSRESGQPCEEMEEENYMFPLHRFSEELREWHAGNVIFPAFFKSSLESTLNNLGDLSVSRSSDRLPWGIPVPGDASQTIYVWVDALVNYLTACGYPHRTDGWPVDCHIVGKDILKFHAIYWPAFLMAADMPLPKSIFCHSHWLVDDRKMSKSLGNVVDPMTLRDKYTSDGLRYFLLREGVPSHDGNYTEAKMVAYLNSELCNTLGNLLSRCTSKSLNAPQIYPPLNHEVYDSVATAEWREVIAGLEALPDAVAQNYNDFNFYKGIDCIMSQLRRANGLMESVRPWELKNDPDVLHTFLHVVMENLRISAILLLPIMPNLSNELLDRLSVPTYKRTVEYLLPVSGYTQYRQIRPGAALYKRIQRDDRIS